MTVNPKKYNPGFLSDDELKKSFCVRTNELASIVETLRENTGSSNQHMLVIGPRGSGKTTLLLRVAIEIRQDNVLSSRLFPIVFAEESYEVGTCGEFWLECLSRLAEQVPNEEEKKNMRRTWEDLRTIRDDEVLAGRCLGALLDYSDREGKKLVLIVENMNMIFRDTSDIDMGWRLRKTLQTEPRIMLLGSATSRFEEIDNPEHAFYDLFRVLTLRPLSTQECATLWEKVSGATPVNGKIRSLEILTGSNPRLIAIIASFGRAISFRDLMKDLFNLIDDHTEYFRSHLEALSAQERRVYLALATLWKPATAREIADHARLETNLCSALLRRLIERGVVSEKGGTPRRKRYYFTERLYNIYYLLRSGLSNRLVEPIIQFMVSWYSDDELGEILQKAEFEVQETSQDYLTRFDKNNSSMISFNIAQKLLHKANFFVSEKNFIQAVKMYNNLIDRFIDNKLPQIISITGMAAANKGLLLWQSIQPSANPDHYKNVWLYLDDKDACRRDVQVILAFLSETGDVQDAVIRALLAFGLSLGYESMLALIQESEPEELLLPLVTAFRQELGLETEVADEVFEIARDVRKGLAEARRVWKTL